MPVLLGDAPAEHVGEQVVALDEVVEHVEPSPQRRLAAGPLVDRRGGLGHAEDVTDAAAVEQAVRDCEALVHAGSVYSLDSRDARRIRQVNVRGTYLATQLCLPHLLAAPNPHVLNIAPPLNLNPRWFAPHVAYTIAKYGMSLCALGMAREFRGDGIAVNTLWPRTVIATAAIQMIPGVDAERCRKPEILSDAAYFILTSDAKATSGNFFIDDELLALHGVTDLEPYSLVPGTTTFRPGT